jgi:hypothetical protein
MVFHVQAGILIGRNGAGHAFMRRRRNPARLSFDNCLRIHAMRADLPAESGS